MPCVSHWNSWLLCLALLFPAGLGAQVQIRTQPKQAPAEQLPDTARPELPPPIAPAPLPAPSDTVQLPQASAAPGGIDTLVVFAARDSMLFVASERRLRLRGDARLALRQQELTAEVIELWVESSELAAEGVPDSGSGSLRGTPVFREGDQTYSGERLRYSFRTRRGIVTGVSTQLGEGFYRGERLKQEAPGIFFVSQGCYTTCDAPHPHFRFCSPRMKVIAGDRVFVSPLVLYVADVPVFIFPFGLFFPNRGGRQSGVITPSFFFSATGGLVLENLGYFYAPNDYWDVQLRTTLRTRQGVVFHGLFRYALRDRLQGSVGLSGGWTRPDLDSPLQPQWNLSFQHRQKIAPPWDLQANVQLSSPDYFRQVSTDIRQRVLGSLLSTVSSSYLFESGASLSLSLQREQDLLSRAHSGTVPQLSVTLPTWMPLQRWYSAPQWVRQLNVDYTMTTFWRYRRAADGTYSHQSAVVHRPSLRVAPRLGYFSISPTFSYEERWYFRELRQWMRQEDSSLVQQRLPGFFREYSYSLGFSISTRLYGIADMPALTGAQAFRHVLQPTVSLSYVPAFPQFYGRYTDYRRGTEVFYSRFALDGGGFAPQKQQLRLDYRFLNSFELKLLPRDTAPPPTVEFFRFTLAGSYNPLADSLRWSDLRFDFSIPALRAVNLQGSATATPYLELPVALPGGVQWQRLNRLRIAEGLFPLRWTSVSLQADVSFRGQLGSTSPSRPRDTADWFGELPTPVSMPPVPWQLRCSASLRYDEPIRGQISRSVGVNIEAGTTLGGWDVRASFNLDLVNRQLLTPVLSIVRQLHCWELWLQWYPLGTFRGYWLRFSPKASVLRDLKYEEKTIPGL